MTLEKNLKDRFFESAKAIVYIMLLSSVFCSNASALEVDVAKSDAKERPWWIYHSLGGGVFYYPAGFDDVKNVSGNQNQGAASQNGAHLGLSIDPIGIYHEYPSEQNLLLGVNTSFGYDTYEANSGGKFHVLEALYSFSAMYFVSQEEKRGVFLRSDVGFAHLGDGVDGQDAYAKYDGIGGVLGVGWAFKWKRHASSIIELCYKNLYLQGAHIESFKVDFGVLY